MLYYRWLRPILCAQLCVGVSDVARLGLDVCVVLMKTAKADTVGLFSSSNDKKTNYSSRGVPDKACLTHIVLTIVASVSHAKQPGLLG